jgi:hypothetical protein
MTDSTNQNSTSVSSSFVTGDTSFVSSTPVSSAGGAGAGSSGTQVNPVTPVASAGGASGTGGGQAVQNQEFDIPEVVKEKYPDLMALILETKSMDKKERQYWFHILPVMNENQVTKLRTILENEKKKLAAIDTKYAGKMPAPGAAKAPVVPMTDGEIKAKMNTIKASESEHEKSETQKEEELLKQLENM